MSFKPSIILKINNQNTPLDSFVNWINKNKDSNQLNSENIVNQANITLINQEGESIKIKTVREIKEQLAYSAYNANETRYFVFLDAHLTTIPAQNALLKSIEEPPNNTQVILVTHTPTKLLETIISRCDLVYLDKKDNNIKIDQNIKEVKELYSILTSESYSDKIDLASKYKDRVEAVKICNDLINFLHSELRNNIYGYQTNEITRNISILLETIKHLEANTNVLLTLENYFFKIS